MVFVLIIENASSKDSADLISSKSFRASPVLIQLRKLFNKHDNFDLSVLGRESELASELTM
jgi:hypothetical protein